jgi:hypothetical protein
MNILGQFSRERKQEIFIFFFRGERKDKSDNNEA